MISPNIPRQKYLDLIESHIESVIYNNSPEFIEIIGDAGIGKTHLLAQLKEYIGYYGIFPQFIISSGSQNFNLSQSLSEYAHNNGLSVLLNKIQMPELPIEKINQILIDLRDPRKDVLIYIIDDAHLLSEGILEQLKLLFDPEYTSGRRLLILASRESCGIPNQIQLTPFTDDEFDEYISELLSPSWKNDYPEGYLWLKTVSGNHPYHLFLLLSHTTSKGLITHSYSAPIDLLNDTQFPKHILGAVASKHQLTDMTNRQRLILSVFAINDKRQTTKVLSKVLELSIGIIRKELKQLLKSGWIVKTNGHRYNLYHPLVREMILSKLSDDELENLHRRCLIQCTDDISERAKHILHLKSTNEAEQNILLQYAINLEKDGLYYSAIQIYRKLNKLNPKDIFQYNIGKNFALLYKAKEAEEKLKTFIDQKSFKFQAEANYYLGTLEIEKGRLQKSMDYLNKALGLIEPTTEIWLKVIPKLLGVHAAIGEVDKVTSLLTSLEKEQFNSEKYKLTYLHAQAMLNFSSPIEGFKIEHVYKEAIRMALDQQDYIKASDLEITMMHHFHNLDKKELKGREYMHVERALEYAKQSYNPKQLINAKRALSFVLAENEENAKLIENHRSLIEIMKKQNILSGLPHAVASLVRDTYFLGYLKQAEIEYSKANKIVFSKQNQDTKSKLLLCEYLMDSGNFSEGMKWLRQIKKEADLSGDEFHSSVSQGFMYPAIFENDPKKAEQSLAKVNKYLESAGMQVLNYIFAQVKAYVLLEHDDIEKFKLHEKTSPEIHKDSIELNIIQRIIKGNIDAAFALILKIETSFDGSGLLYAMKTYQWLSKQKIERPKATKRWTYIYKLIFAITHHHSAEIENYKGTKNDFILLLEAWQLSIANSVPFHMNKILNFTKDTDTQKKIASTINLWGIDIVEESVSMNNQEKGIPIVINLLGIPALFINQRKLSSKDWSNKRSLEILIYILLRSWKNEYPIRLDEILRDFWNPSADEMDRCRKIRNNMMSRMRKTFKDISDEMIIHKDGEIQFNWASDKYRLDIDSFNYLMDKGKNAHRDNKMQDAIRYFESAFNLYRGNLADGVDGVWIEAIRSHFYQEYMALVETLTDIYTLSGKVDKVNQMLKKVKSIYPGI